MTDSKFDNEKDAFLEKFSDSFDPKHEKGVIRISFKRGNLTRQL